MWQYVSLQSMASLDDDIHSAMQTCGLRTQLRETRAALQLAVHGREGN